MKMNHKRASKTSSQSQPSPCLWAKASEASHLSNSPAGATSDGVVVGGMVGNDIEISREICGGEAGASTGATSLATDKGAGTVAEVGAADSSVDLWDTIGSIKRKYKGTGHLSRRGSIKGQVIYRVPSPKTDAVPHSVTVRTPTTGTFILYAVMRKLRRPFLETKRLHRARHPRAATTSRDSGLACA